MKSQIGLTQELQPNGMIAKSSIRWGFVFIHVFAAVLTFLCLAIYYYQVQTFIAMMKTTVETTINGQVVKMQLLSSADFRLNVSVLLGIPITFILGLLGVAYGGKSVSKYAEGKSLDNDTPVLTQQ